jgi:hypothetical protein
MGIDDDQAHGLADLRGRQPDAGLVVDDLEHVVRERADLVGDLCDRLRHRSQALVGKLEHVP